MIRFSLLLLSMTVLPVQAGQLYKCVNAAKEVTYTNLPCSKFPGMREAKAIDADPGPPVQDIPKPARKTKSVDEPVTQETKKSSSEKAAARRILKAEKAEKNKCDKLSDQISDVMDKMDAARRKGYTAKQESDWNQKIKELNAKKNRLNCF